MKRGIFGLKDGRIVTIFPSCAFLSEAYEMDELKCDYVIEITEEDLLFISENIQTTPAEPSQESHTEPSKETSKREQ